MKSTKSSTIQRVLRFALVICALGLSACGQKGPLIPAKAEPTATGAGAAAPSPTPAASATSAPAVAKP